MLKKKIFVALAFVLTLAISVVAFASYERTADNTVPAYTDPDLRNRNGNERVDAGDRLIVFEERENAYYVRYPVRNGTKDRWVPKNVFNNNRANFQLSNYNLSCPSERQLRFTGRLWNANNNSEITGVHVYIGGGVGAGGEFIGEFRTDNNHNFNHTMNVPANRSGNQLVVIYAVNGIDAKELDRRNINISNSSTPSGNYDSKVNAFKSNLKYQHNGNTGWDCGAFADEFAKVVFGKSSKTDGRVFYDQNQIQSGDIVHVNPRDGFSENPHWIVILYRNGNQLITMEGNWLTPKTYGLNGKIYGRTRYSEDKYTIENGRFCLNHTPFRKWDRGYHFK